MIMGLSILLCLLINVDIDGWDIQNYNPINSSHNL